MPSQQPWNPHEPCSWEKGKRNAITDVEGLEVGNTHSTKWTTGTTVVLPDQRVVAAADVRGGGTGTREINVMDAWGLSGRIDGLFLSGGSSYGLGAGTGVADFLGEHGRGYPLFPSVPVSPVVPGAILYDLLMGEKNWGPKSPYEHMGREACENASKDVPCGNVGAGYAARAGIYKGGLGTASRVFSNGVAIGALVAVNAFGSPVIPGSSTLWSAFFQEGNEMGTQSLPKTFPLGNQRSILNGTRLDTTTAPHNTTLAIVATNVALDAGMAKRVAIMAQDGLARAISPIHTPFDGDVVFALSTKRLSMMEGQEHFGVLMLGAHSAECLSRAVGRAIFEAESLGDSVSYRDYHGMS